ncbi:MAG: hypothetical protein BHV94_04010 [Clostridiales bacterium 59_14]|nr:MAG: hypothetical protein BHV94_04010 [Clostridiales bacterium 59_14]
MKTKVLVVAGPTASGKTGLGIALARRLDGEIVCADSMQIYTGMPIATAAPTAAERQAAVHHLAEILPPDTPFSVAQYCKLAAETVANIAARGKVPILVGGTGLFIDSFIDHIQFAHVQTNPDLRRELLEELAKRRMDIPPRRKLPALPLPDAPEGGQAMRFTCSVQKAEQVTAALLAEKPAAVYVPVEELERLDPELDWGETELCAVLPRIFRTADETPLRQLLEQHPEASAVAIGNLGHLPIARGLNRTLRGDFGLNIFNSRALLFWQGQELASATVSFELRWQQVRDLRKYLPCEAIIYGRLPLMVTENCVTRCSVGCTHGAGSVLTDRTGARFPVLCGYGCRCEIQNSKTLFLADKPEMRRCGLTYGRLRFTTETPEQCVQVLQRYQNGGNWTPEDLTRGLFYRGVE